MASLRNQNANQRLVQSSVDNPLKPRKPLVVFPGAENPNVGVRKPGVPAAVAKHQTKYAPVASVKQDSEEVKKEKVSAAPPKLPTLSSLRDSLPLAKRQRLLQDVVRTAGKENGFLTFRERPADVSDIYKDEIENEALVVAYVEHIYAYLHEREASRVSSKYMDNMSVNPRMRAILIDWIVSVVYKFKMCQDTLYLTVDIVDRFLSIPQLDVTKDELQLIGVTAMFIASKFEEVYPPELEDYVFIADNACNKVQILETEMLIANALNFNFTRPTAAHFVRRCTKASQGDVVEYNLTKYITELSLLNIEFVELRPSLVAAAAVYLASVMNESSRLVLWDSCMEYYSFHKEKDVKPVAAKLLQLVKDAPKSRQQCIYKKYCSQKIHAVAMNSENLAATAAAHFDMTF